jgi:hypothetical protein
MGSMTADCIWQTFCLGAWSVALIAATSWEDPNRVRDQRCDNILECHRVVAVPEPNLPSHKTTTPGMQETCRGLFVSTGLEWAPTVQP